MKTRSRTTHFASSDKDASRFPFMAMTWPGIGIAAGMAYSVAVDSIGWALQSVAGGGLVLAIHILVSVIQSTSDRMTTGAEQEHSGDT